MNVLHPRSRPPRPRRRDERGVAATVLLSTGMIIGVAILLVWAAPLTVATDAKSRNQAAADAGAIAAAEAVRVPPGITSLLGFDGNLSNLLDLLDGEAAARRLVEENDPGATIVGFGHTSLEATVTVRSKLESGEIVTSSAKARLDLPSCSSREQEVEPEDPPEDEDGDGEDGDGEDGEGDADADGGEEDPPPPPEKVTVWSCGGVTLNDPDNPGVDISALLSNLLSGSKAKLVD